MNTIIQNVRKKVPLIHNITNYVTVNDVANIILACGASPIMADDEREAEEITQHWYIECQNDPFDETCGKESKRTWTYGIT